MIEQAGTARNNTVNFNRVNKKGALGSLERPAECGCGSVRCLIMDRVLRALGERGHHAVPLMPRGGGWHVSRLLTGAGGLRMAVIQRARSEASNHTTRTFITPLGASLLELTVEQM